MTRLLAYIAACLNYTPPGTAWNPHGGVNVFNSMDRLREGTGR